jgi:CheY-like chemotaxis protein
MQGKILWADDEIELLKPHIMFLESKGYVVDSVNNGADAVEKSNDLDYDIIFLDENMPGISGLEALSRIKEVKPYVPVVMITKSEEEHIKFISGWAWTIKRPSHGNAPITLNNSTSDVKRLLYVLQPRLHCRKTKKFPQY